MPELRRVTALVDWDSARRIAASRNHSEIRLLETVFFRLQNAIANYITAQDDRNRYRVGWRIYHGWHQGKTKTKDRHLFETFARTARPRNIRFVSFGADFAYGDALCCATHRNPIFDTLRFERNSKILRQKMVDTILVCDLLHLVRCKDSYLYIIVADDDDLVPAIFTAEMWKGNVVWLHNRELLNPHLRLGGLSARMDIQ